MNSGVLIVIGVVAFALAYRFYARKIAGVLGIDAGRSTPAHTMEDGVDYCPARMPVLLGHHFSSIAGAAPIIGPVTAAAFGWGPVFIWIILGAIFLGAVHDLSALIVSIRHSGRSIGEVIEEFLGTTGKVFFLIFCLATLLLLIAVFMAVVAKTFVESPATATSSLMYLMLALVFSLLVNKLRFSFKWMTIVFVPLLFLSVWVGVHFPLSMPQGGVVVPGLAIAVSPTALWILVLLVYVFVASVTPVWILLQPRDYLSSFLLYALIGAGVIGIVIVQPAIRVPMFTSFTVGKLGSLFPMLFVTVACGAISGFHSVVASGTSSKQLNKETDAVPVAYGAMLIEGLLALIALVTAVRLGSGQYAEMLSEKGPIAVFASGIGSCLAWLYISPKHGVTFATLAVSAFALTTLDTGTRLSRFCLQELFARKKASHDGGKRKTIDRFTATSLCVIAGGALALSGEWKTIWPVFGSANQLLAAIALLAVSVWLYHRRRPVWYTGLPMCFMFLVTLSALSVSFFTNLTKARALWAQLQVESTAPLRYMFVTKGVLAGISMLLFILAIALLALAIKTIARSRRASAA